MSIHEMFIGNRIFELEQRVSYLEGIIDIIKNKDDKEEEK